MPKHNHQQKHRHLRRVRIRIEQARITYIPKEIFWNSMRCYVLFVLYYRIKTWAAKENGVEKPKASEPLIYLRMLSNSFMKSLTSMKKKTIMHMRKKLSITASDYAGQNLMKEFRRKKTKLIAEERLVIVWMH